MHLLLSILLTIICYSATSFAQTLPELKIRYTQSLPDTAKVNLANRIAWLSSTTDSATTFSFANEALQLASPRNYVLGKGQALMAKGNYFVSKAKGSEAAPLFQQAILLFSAINNALETAKAKEYLGKAYSLSNQNTKALELYREAEKVFVQHSYQEGLSMVYNNIGIAFSNLGDPEKAIEGYLKALAIDERQNNMSQVPMTLNNIGKLFLDIKNYSEARHYLLQSIDKCRAAKDLLTMGKAQLNCGNTFVMEQQYDKGIGFIKEALQTFEKINFTRGVQTCYNNLGALHLLNKQYSEALPHLHKALELAQKTAAQTGVGLIQQNIAYGHIFLKHFDDAEAWFTKAEATMSKSPDPYTIGEIYKHRALLDSARGDYKSAYENKTRYLYHSEKFLSERNLKQINELRTKFEAQQKEAQIALLNKDNSIKELEIRNQKLTLAEQLFQLTENRLALSEADLELATSELQLEGQKQIILKQKLDSTQRVKNIQELKRQSELQQLEIKNRQLQLSRRNVLIGLLLALSALGSLLGYSFYRRKQLKQEAKLQAEVLRQQELATKAILEAEEAERQRIAKDLHDGVGQMMSAAKMNLSAYEHEVAFASPEAKQSFERIISLVDDSCKEVRAVSHNMMPNALLKNSLAAAIREFVDKLDHKALKVHLYTDGLDDRLDSNVETVLYRVIQECVNNVIKHADANVLDLSIVKDSQEITATIEDNGKGFDITDSGKFDGIGLKNIRTRIEYLKGSVDFNSVSGKGTLVAIHVPL
jgi:signal transduction histidine kinase